MELLTEREAAEMLRLSLRTLQRLNKDGTGPHKLQLTVRRVAYRRADILAWIAVRETAASTQPIAA
jgi:predicted DNA-binding transcriptional regulator AlpA